MKILKPALGALLALISYTAFAAVDVNKADQNELQGVKGVGPAMSTKILDARKTGPFKDWDDLQSRVKGIGPGSSTKLSAEGLNVSGAAYGEAPAPEPAAKTAKAKAPAAAAKK